METLEKKNIKAIAGKTGKFLKDNRRTLLSLGILFGAACFFGPEAMATSANNDPAFNQIVAPMTKFETFMTGPVPKAIGTIGIGMVGASWAFNIENQITKAGLRLFGGTAAAVGASSLIGISGAALIK